jgi:hypothetical protein
MGEEIESVSGYGKKAKRHARESRMRTQRMIAGASSRSGPVKVSYLPGFEKPLRVSSDELPTTKFPFAAKINGELVTVWPDWIEWEE